MKFFKIDIDRPDVAAAVMENSGGLRGEQPLACVLDMAGWVAAAHRPVPQTVPEIALLSPLPLPLPSSGLRAHVCGLPRPRPRDGIQRRRQSNASPPGARAEWDAEEGLKRGGLSPVLPLPLASPPASFRCCQPPRLYTRPLSEATRTAPPDACILLSSRLPSHPRTAVPLPACLPHTPSHPSPSLPPHCPITFERCHRPLGADM